MFTSPSQPRGPARARTECGSGAFTLLEIILSMAVFSIIAISVFGVVDATMVSSGELQVAQRINRETAGFIELCRKSFATLPAAATIRSNIEEEIAPDGQEILFSNAPSIFSWGDNALNYGTTTLGVRAQEDGKFSLAISRSDFIPPEDEVSPVGAGVGMDTTLDPDDQGRYWLPLIPDLQWVQWRFFDDQIDDWADSWTRATRPHLVELQFLLPDDTIPVRAVFTVCAAAAPPPTR